MENGHSKQVYPTNMKASHDIEDKKFIMKTQRCWKRFVYIQSVLTLLLLFALLGLTVYWRQIRMESLSPKQNKMSVPCANMQDEHDDDYGEFVVTFNKEKNETFCFGDVSDVLNRLVKKNVKQQFRENYASRLFSSIDSSDCQHTTKKKPAASVFGLSLQHMHDDLIHWNHKSSKSFHNGVHYNRGHLEIKQSGYYYVYSQIKLGSQPSDKELIQTEFSGLVSKGNKTTAESNDEMIQRHYIHVRSQSSENERRILESFKSRCGISEDREITSAIGAIFYLNANDTLFVKTSHPKHLAACDRTNYFGAYMV